MKAFYTAKDGHVAWPVELFYRIAISALPIFLFFSSSTAFAQTLPSLYTVYQKVTKSELDSVFTPSDKLPQIIVLRPSAHNKFNADTGQMKYPDTLRADSLHRNKYGDLLADNKAYNPRYPVWKPAAEVIGINAFIWSMDRFFL